MRRSGNLGKSVISEKFLPDPSSLHLFRKNILTWYDNYGRQFPWRKKSATCYMVVIAEVLLQRTRAEVVSKFYREFIKEFPSWRKLSEASESSLANFLRPIGLWRRRASSINLLSKKMAQRHGRFPKSREEIEALPNVGQYIANAISLFCHGEPHPLIDINMARVLERVFGPRKLADIRYDPYLQSLALAVVQCEQSKDINWAILDLASTICLPRKPRSNECPVNSICLSARGIKGT